VAEEQGRPRVGYLLIARLKPEATPPQAQAELNRSIPTFRFNPPIPTEFQMLPVVEPLQTALVAETGTSLWLLLFAVGFVLLIACVNVANLSLMRTARRAHELAIRVALGAGKRDLLAYSFAETLLLAVSGTLVGFALSVWITDGVLALAPSRVPRLDETSIDASVFLFAVAVCILTTVIFGMLPALRASEADPHESLNSASRSQTENSRGRRIRAVLVTAEVTLGTLLSIGSGLLLISLHRTMNAPKGFAGDHVLTSDFRLPQSKFQTVDAVERFFRGLHDELASAPGVAHIAAATILPLHAENFAPVVTANGVGTERRGLVTWPAVSSGYFRAMDIPLREGRFFYERETDDVAVVSESAARMLWPGQNPIGKRISRDENVPR
jgi:predicted permease